jgi:hypothetical protein
MGGSHVRELALLDQAGQALAEAQSFDKIKEIRDKAEAVRKYAQSASLGLGIQNRAAEVKLRAERQAGKLLAQIWQMQARVPENVFREHVKVTCDSGKELTSARLLRLAKQWEDSSPPNGHSHELNGNGKHHGAAIGRRTRISDARRDGNPLADIVSELTNHHELLDNVLRPMYSGEVSNLAPADRRVLRYLLLEVRQLLGRLDKFQQLAIDCACHDEQAR